MSAWNDLYLPLATIAAPIMQAYCNRHGYTFLRGEYHDRAETQEDRLTRGDLCKAGMFRQHYADFEILCWLDIDSVVMNHSLRIEDQLNVQLGFPQTRDWLWTCDQNGPLSGFWIARCTPLIRKWVERFSFACAYEDGGGDQYAMQIISARPPYRFLADEKHCVYGKVAGHCYDYAAMGMPDDLAFFNKYEPGDWIVTFPSLDLSRRMELMLEYASKVTL